MANINETISEVAKLNPELACQIQKYVKEHLYGLVFEHNLPEAVRLYKKQPAVGDMVNILAPRGKKETEENSVPWCVKYIDNGVAYLEHDGEAKDVLLEDTCVLVSYRDVIYPGLKEIDRVERGNPEDPYHMVINSENYHPGMFGSVLVVSDEKNKICRYLDLMTKPVQDALENFKGNSAKELFMGALGKNYTVVSDK